MERIRLRFRCDLRWDDLEGESAVERRCGECGQDVINLSSLTRPAAERLLAERIRARGAGRVCVRFVQDAEGRVEYAEPVTERTPKRRLCVLSELGAAAALATVISLPRASHADLSSQVPGKPGMTTAQKADPPKPVAATATATAQRAVPPTTGRRPDKSRPLMGKPVLHRESMGDIAE